MATFRKALPTPAGEPEARQTPRAIPGWIVLAGVGLLYVALAPLTATLGGVFAYNVAETLGLASSAMAAFVMIRRYVRVPDSIGTLAALVGGALFGFSPYMAAHALGHPPAVILFTAPLML